MFAELDRVLLHTPQNGIGQYDFRALNLRQAMEIDSDVAVTVQREGEHLVVRMPITYTQAALGAKIEVPTLAGPHELKLPAGTQTGEVFRVRGQGMPSPRGRSVGDLLVQVNVEVPKSLSAEQEELLRQLAEQEKVEVSPHRKSFFEKVREYFAQE